MIRADTRPRHRNSGKADELRRCTAHLQWIRGRQCCVSRDGLCAGRIEAAHVDHAGGKGTSTKVPDFFAVPLCTGHHAELHRGARTFEMAHQIDLVATAGEFARRSPRAAELAEMRTAWLAAQPRSSEAA